MTMNQVQNMASSNTSLNMKYHRQNSHPQIPYNNNTQINNNRNNVQYITTTNNHNGYHRYNNHSQNITHPQLQHQQQFATSSNYSHHAMLPQNNVNNINIQHMNQTRNTMNMTNINTRIQYTPQQMLASNTMAMTPNGHTMTPNPIGIPPSTSASPNPSQQSNASPIPRQTLLLSQPVAAVSTSNTKNSVIANNTSMTPSQSDNPTISQGNQSQNTSPDQEIVSTSPPQTASPQQSIPAQPPTPPTPPTPTSQIVIPTIIKGESPKESQEHDQDEVSATNTKSNGIDIDTQETEKKENEDKNDDSEKGNEGEVSQTDDIDTFKQKYDDLEDDESKTKLLHDNIYKYVMESQPLLAAKITGMIINGQDNDKLLKLLIEADHEKLKKKIESAVEILTNSNSKQNERESCSYYTLYHDIAKCNNSTEKIEYLRNKLYPLVEEYVFQKNLADIITEMLLMLDVSELFVILDPKENKQLKQRMDQAIQAYLHYNKHVIENQQQLKNVNADNNNNNAQTPQNAQTSQNAQAQLVQNQGQIPSQSQAQPQQNQLTQAQMQHQQNQRALLEQQARAYSHAIAQMQRMRQMQQLQAQHAAQQAHAQRAAAYHHAQIRNNQQQTTNHNINVNLNGHHSMNVNKTNHAINGYHGHTNGHSHIQQYVQQNGRVYQNNVHHRR